jgi:PKD repeat protein
MKNLYALITIFLLITNITLAAITVHIDTTHVKCMGDSSGSIKITVIPSGTYLYSVDGGTTYRNNGNFNVYAGSYNVRVIEKAGSTITFQFDSADIKIPEPSSGITIDGIMMAMPRCHGGGDGIVLISAYNPNLNALKYSIDGGAYQNNNMFNKNIFAGVHKIMVKDTITGCVKMKDTVLPNTPKMKTLCAITNVYGSKKGSIKITKLLNVNPLYDSVFFSINNGVNWKKDSTFSGLDAGAYAISVKTKIYNCQFDTTFIIGTDVVLSATADTIGTIIKCNGDSTGKINIIVTDPNPTFPIWFRIRGPVNDSIQLNASTYSFNNLLAGNYLVMAKDNIGAFFVDLITLHQPDKFSIAASIIAPVCNLNSNGSINLSVNGGTPPYSYAWSTNAITKDLNHIPPGSYKVTITDNKNCKDSKTFMVNTMMLKPDLPILTRIISAQPPANDTVRTIMCKGADQTLQVTNQKNDTVKWFDGNNNLILKGVTYNISNIARDVSLKVNFTDTNNCVSDDKLITIHMDKLKAGFSVQPTTVKVGAAVSFTDTSKNAIRWSWTFGNKEGASTLQNPVFYFNSGIKDIKLVVSSINCRDSVTKLSYINVTNTGLREINCSALEGIVAYPSPFKDIIIIDFADIDTDVAISVFNLSGIKLMETKVSHANGIEKIDASGLPAGTYILVLTIGESSSAFKLIKE